MAFDVLAAANEAAKVSVDMNVAKTFEDFEREIPAAGPTRLRFIEYIELGSHQEEFQGKPKTVEKVHFAFELSGPKHPPKIIDGVAYPHVISFKMTKSQSDKAKFFKLFKAMNYDGSATFFPQLLGKSYRATVFHNVSKQDEKVVYANLYNEDGYSIRSPFFEDPETGETRKVEADPVRSTMRLFIWATASKAMWDSIFVDGKWPDKKDDKGNITKEGASKNYFQNMIKTALDFKGSPASECVLGDLDIPAATAPERSAENVQAAAETRAPNKSGASKDPLSDLDDEIPF